MNVSKNSSGTWPRKGRRHAVGRFKRTVSMKAVTEDRKRQQYGETQEVKNSYFDGKSR